VSAPIALVVGRGDVDRPSSGWSALRDLWIDDVAVGTSQIGCN
jgi:hypothetical protein